MSRQGRRAGFVGCAVVLLAGFSVGAEEPREDRAVAAAGAVLASPQSGRAVFPSAQGPSSGGAMPITSIQQLVRMSGPELDGLYQGASIGSMPCGRVKGRVILYAGTRLAVPTSKVARLMWQGKVFLDDRPAAVNRFFGVRVIKADVYQGESWLDGAPSLILDYSKTSLLYKPYRDEIREVGPGIYLGLMYSRTEPQPTFKMYFALEAR